MTTHESKSITLTTKVDGHDANSYDDAYYMNPGDLVEITLKATNTGNVALSPVIFQTAGIMEPEPPTDPATGKPMEPPVLSIEPGESITQRYTVKITKPTILSSAVTANGVLAADIIVIRMGWQKNTQEEAVIAV